MARVPYLDPQDLPQHQRELLDRPININRALANRPGVLAANRAMGRWARWSSAVDPRLRELAIVAVGVVTGNQYEYAHHIHIAQQFGASSRDLDDVQRFLLGEPTSLEPEALVVLDTARRLTVAGSLRDEHWADLQEAVGATAAMDLVVIVAYYAMVVRVLGALDVDLEAEWADYARGHPLRDPFVRGASREALSDGLTPPGEVK